MAALGGDLRELIEYDQETARPLLVDLVNRLPRSVDARVLLAKSFLRSLEPEPALQHLLVASALEPSNLSIRHQMGLCAIAKGDYEAALGVFRDALSLSPKEHSAAMAALMLHRLGRFDEAMKMYSDLLAKLKRDHAEAPHALRGISMLLRDAGSAIAADGYMHELNSVYRFNPVQVAGLLVERDNSIDFHEWTAYATKNGLARALRRHAERKSGMPVFPATFVLPGDRAAFATYAAQEPSAAFIAKPHRGTGGQGIAISRDASAFVDRDDVVVQRYIDRPYLVDERKGHIRVYGLIASLAPFRAYVYRDGIVRFAPEAYDASEAGLANVHCHVTNTARHRRHPNLEVSNDPTKENVGNVWSLRAYLERLKADGSEVTRVWADIRALVKGFLAVLAADGVFARQIKTSPRRAFPPKLFGLYVLLDADGKPWLIEAQRKPALGGSALVQRINGQMFRTIFAMSCARAFDDQLPADRIGLLAKDRNALAAREAELEIAHKGLFEPLV